MNTTTDSRPFKSLVLLAASILLAGCGNEQKAENAALRTDIQTVTAEKNSLEIDLAKKSAELEGAGVRFSDMKVRGDDIAKQLSSTETDNQNLRARLAEATAQMTAATARSDAVQKELDSLKAADQKAESARLNEQANRKGELSGSVSYFFNDNYGYKPDSGSEAYVWKKGDFPESFRVDLQKYLLAKSVLVLKALGGQMSDSDYKIMSATGISTQAALNAKGDLLFKQYLELTNSSRAIAVSVDGSGSFHHSLAPGDYYALVHSAHRTHDTTLEISGAVDLAVFTITSGEETNVTVKFEVE